MSEREITLHIGLPKTATTTIQRHLFRNADYLRELGVDYCPDLCPIGYFSNADSHYAIASAYCMPKAIHSQPISVDLVRDRLSASGRYLFSAEEFSSGNNVQIKALAEDLGLPKKRRVFVTFRDEVDYIRSRWMQDIKMGFSFDSLWECYSRRYKPGRRPYSELLKGWRNSGFSVVAVRYEDLRATADATQAMLRKLYDVEVDPERWITLKNANVSPSPEVLARYQSVAKPVVALLGEKRAQGIRPRVYKRIHDRLCSNSFVGFLGKNTEYEAQVERIKKDLASLPEIADLPFETFS
ncbi:hypothetical protein N9N48_06435 [Luminiphilus sp.]|nr:hypothetical protein [Luminiphilus sp.]